jgi:P-type Ca2+ transporter type 2C
MDTFAALALATDPPSQSLLNRKPQPKSAPLITVTMWKMIIGQAIFQLVITLLVYFLGAKLALYDSETAELGPFVFNTFVWLQIFNQYNARRLDNGFNILEGVYRNYFFIGIQVIIVSAQVLIMFFGGVAFRLPSRLTGLEWGVSILIGLFSVPIAMAIRLIPDRWCSKLVPKYFKKKKTPELRVTEEGLQYEWNPAIEDIRDELMFLKVIRGGRLQNLKYKLQNPRALLPRSRSGSRSGSRSRTNSVPRTPNPEDNLPTPGASPGPPTPESHRSQRRRARSRANSAFGPAAAMAGIVAGSVAGWSPIDRRHNDNFGRFPLQDRSDLEGYSGIEVHPATKPEDPVLADPAGSSKPPSQMPDSRPTFDAHLHDESGKNKSKAGN